MFQPKCGKNLKSGFVNFASFYENRNPDKFVSLES